MNRPTVPLPNSHDVQNHHPTVMSPLSLPPTLNSIAVAQERENKMMNEQLRQAQQVFVQNQQKRIDSIPTKQSTNHTQPVLIKRLDVSGVRHLVHALQQSKLKSKSQNSNNAAYENRYQPSDYRVVAPKNRSR